jgi:hypothetical protein
VSGMARKHVKAKKSASQSYEAEANDLLAALRISSDVVAESTLYKTNEKKLILKQLSGIEKLLSHPEPAFKNSKSVAFLRQAVIQPWNETACADAGKFWKRVKTAGLLFKPQDVLLEILRRRKIRNEIEYELVTDAFSNGKLSRPKINLLNQMVATYEIKLKSAKRRL